MLVEGDTQQTTELQNIVCWHVCAKSKDEASRGAGEVWLVVRVGQQVWMGKEMAFK